MGKSRCFPSLRCYGFCGSLGDRPSVTPFAAEGSVGLETGGACVPAGRLELIRDPVTATKEHLIGCLAVEGRVRNHCIVLMDVPSDELLKRGEAVQLVKEQPMVLQRSPVVTENRSEQKSCWIALVEAEGSFWVGRSLGRSVAVLSRVCSVRRIAALATHSRRPLGQCGTKFLRNGRVDLIRPACQLIDQPQVRRSAPASRRRQPPQAKRSLRGGLPPQSRPRNTHRPHSTQGAESSMISQ
jgi:hypothetical protein